MPKKVRALLIDLDGVLYQGGRAIRGAPEALRWAQTEGIPHLFLTNTTSKPRRAIAATLKHLGMSVPLDQIMTPPVAAMSWLQDRVTGPVGVLAPQATREELAKLDLAPEDEKSRVSAVVVGDCGKSWTFDLLNLAFRWLMSDAQPPLVALGMTRYWQADDGLRLDAGPFVAALEYATGRQARVLGKPAKTFFDEAIARLGVDPDEACMIGDDVASDIAGAHAAGISGILVETGKFRAADRQALPNGSTTLPSFAELPQWWRESGSA